MNKQTWEKLSLEEQIKWWGSNSSSDATHYGTGMFYKYIEGSWRYWNEHSWVISHNPIGWLTNLIAKPIKPYTPKIGEECEAVDYDCGNDKYYERVIFIGDNPKDTSYGSFKAFSRVSGGDLFWSDKFRPIITERDTRAVDLYRMFHNDGLQAREIMQSDKFNTYLSMWDTLVRIQRGDV